MFDFALILPYLRAKDRLRCEKVCRLWWASSRFVPITSDFCISHYRNLKGDTKVVAIIADDFWVDLSDDFPFSDPFLVQNFGPFFDDEENFEKTSPKFLELIEKILKRIGPDLKSIKFLEKFASMAEPSGYGSGRAPRALIYENLLQFILSLCPNLKSMHFGNVKFMRGTLL